MFFHLFCSFDEEIMIWLQIYLKENVKKSVTVVIMLRPKVRNLKI